jgi:DNA-binding transcriptional MerR regulator
MLDHWARTKLLPPSGREASGKGSRRQYTFKDVVAILTIRKLRERKCPLRQIRSAVRYLRTHYPDATTSDTLASLTLLTDGREVYVLNDERQVMNIVTRQCVWSIPLGLVISEANEKCATLPEEWLESVKVKGRNFRLLISRDTALGEYIVECRQLPGFLERGSTPIEAAKKGKTTINSLLSFQQRRQQKGRPSSTLAG